MIRRKNRHVGRKGSIRLFVWLLLFVTFLMTSIQFRPVHAQTSDTISSQGENDYFYEQLDTRINSSGVQVKTSDHNEKVFYDTLVKMFETGVLRRSGDTEVPISASGSSEALSLEVVQRYTQGDSTLLTQMTRAKDAFQYDHPEVFYVDFSLLTLKIKMDESGTLKCYLGAGRSDTYYLEGFTNEDQVQAAVKDLESTASRIVEDAKAYKPSGPEQDPAISQIEYVHDYIVQNMIYRFEYEVTKTSNGKSNARTAYDALIYGEGVCEAYTRGFKYLMDCLGIPTICVYGTYSPSVTSTEEHIWNYVKVGGKWYGVDATHDDPIAKDKRSITGIINKKNSGIETREFLLVGETDLLDIRTPSGKLSMNYEEFLYPQLEQNNLNGEIDHSSGNFRVRLQKDYYTDEQTGIIHGSGKVDVSYNGKNYSENAKDGLYLLARYMQPSIHEDIDLVFTDWGYITPEIYTGGELEPHKEDPYMGSYLSLSIPQVKKVQFAVTDIAPGDYQNGTIEPDTLIYTEDPSKLLEVSEVVENVWGGTYIAPPYPTTTTPSMQSSMQIGKTYNCTIDYNDVLLKPGTETPATLDDISFDVRLKNYYKQDYTKDYETVTKTGITIVDDGDGKEHTRVSYTFTPSKEYSDDSSFYFISLKGAVGSRSNKEPIAVTYSCVYSFYNCPLKVASSGWDVVGQPVLIDTVDSTIGSTIDPEWQMRTVSTEDGTAFRDSGIDITHRLSLITSAVSSRQEDELRETLNDKYGDSTVTENSKLNVYNIQLRLCKAQVIKTGQGVRVYVGFPEGTGPNDAGTKFSAYHYIVDPKTNEVTGIEEIPCEITPYGLVLTIQSFSPFLITQVSGVDSVSENKVIFFNDDNGGFYPNSEKAVNSQLDENAVDKNLEDELQSQESDEHSSDQEPTQGQENEAETKSNQTVTLSDSQETGELEASNKKDGSYNWINSKSIHKGDQVTVQAKEGYVISSLRVTVLEDGETRTNEVSEARNKKNYALDISSLSEKIAQVSANFIEEEKSEPVEDTKGNTYEGNFVILEDMMGFYEGPHYLPVTDGALSEGYKLPAGEEMTHSGYSFDGWYTENSGGSKVTDASIPNGNGDITLYARWSKDENSSFTVTFDATSGSFKESSSNRLQETEDTRSLTKVYKTDSTGKITEEEINEPIRDGYHFTGWYTSSTIGEKVEPKEEAFTEDTTLYARYELDENENMDFLEITFDANGGEIDGQDTKVLKTDKQGHIEAFPVATREGYTFTGWYLSSKSSNGYDAPLEESYIFRQSTQLYARWIEKKDETEPDPGESDGDVKGQLPEGVAPTLTVDNLRPDNEQAVQNRTVRIRLYDQDGNEYKEAVTIYIRSQDTSEVIQKEIHSGDEITIKAGQRIDLIIPEGIEYELEFDGDSNSIITGIIVKGDPKTVNAQTDPDLVETGRLIITQFTDGNDDPGFDYTIRLKGIDKDLSYAASGDINARLKDGSSFTLKKDQSVQISNLPVGTEYEIIQSENKDYETEAIGAKGYIASKGDRNSVVFKNQLKQTDEESKETGFLALYNSVVGSDSNKSKSVIYRITFSGPSISQNSTFDYTGSITGRLKNEGTVKLKDSEYIMISGIPAGSSYSVTQVDPDQSYQVLKSGDTGTIKKSQISVVQFINIRGNVASTAERIHVSPESLVLNYYGSKSQADLNVTVEPANAQGNLSFISEDPNIARVSGNGKVQAVSQGYTNIIVTCGRASKKIPVTVTVLTSSISLDQGNVILSTLKGARNSVELKATAKPTNSDQKIRWSTTTPQILSVTSSGKVTALAEGRGIVRAQNATMTQDFEITVTNERIVSDGIKIKNKDADTITVVAKNVRINPALDLDDIMVEKVSMFAWSQEDQSDINAKEVTRRGDTNDWSFDFPLNNTEINNFFMNTSDIKIHLYASSETGSIGNLIDIASYDNSEPRSQRTKILINAYTQFVGFNRAVGMGMTAGSVGEARQMEGIRIASLIEGVDIITDVHASGIGWINGAQNGQYAGTMFESRPLEAVRFHLEGPNADKYKLTYQAHVADKGWLPIVSDGNIAGTTGESRRLEAVRVWVEPK